MPQRPFPGTIGRSIADSQPWWPARPDAAGKPPKVLVVLAVLFDDVGFAGFGCYRSSVRTPAIDSLAARGPMLPGTLRKVTTTLGPLPGSDGQALAQAEMARQ